MYSFKILEFVMIKLNNVKKSALVGRSTTTG